jgi:hypothetical protein
MSEFAEAPESPEPPVETPAGGPSERVYPKDTADLVADYFGPAAEARAAEEEKAEAVEREVSDYSEGYLAALSEQDEYDEPQQADLYSMTPEQIQAGIDDGSITDDELRQFVREGIVEELAPGLEVQAEFAEQRAARQQAQQQQRSQLYEEGLQRAQEKVVEAHRKQSVGLLGQERTMARADEIGGEGVRFLLEQGHSLEDIYARKDVVLDWATKAAAEETHRQNIALRVAGRRTDTGRRER